MCFQVLEERIYHIEYNPEVPEPYYQSTGKELQPRPVGEENGIVIYNYNPVSAVNYVSTPKLFISRILKQITVCDPRAAAVSLYPLLTANPTDGTISHMKNNQFNQ